MTTLIAIFIGGGLGSLSRYGISKWLGSAESGFPIGTLVANVVACLILGFVTAAVLRKWELSQPMQAAIMAGFCGGFSTFSTFSLEAFALLQGDKAAVALAYMAASLVLCLLAVWGGSWLGTKLA